METYLDLKRCNNKTKYTRETLCCLYSIENIFQYLLELISCPQRKMFWTANAKHGKNGKRDFVFLSPNKKS